MLAGDLIIWKTGEVGILTERFDFYEGAKYYKRNADNELVRSNCWRWRVYFAGQTPSTYNDKIGVCEGITLKEKNFLKFKT